MSALAAPSSFDAERAFADAMSAAGYQPGPIQGNAGEFVRFDAPGDKKGRRNGYYKLITGNYPVGWFGDWKTNEHVEWQWDFGRNLAPAERDKIKKEHRRLKAEAEVAREQRQREVAEYASELWGKADSNAEGHPYLTKKGIRHPRGVRIHTAKDGTKLLSVPMYAFDMNGRLQLQNLQMISPDGQKRFLAGGRKQGCFFSIKGETGMIVIGEGYATGTTIWQSTGVSTVSAFDSGNLLEVAREIRRHRPDAALMIAGDDDVFPSEAWIEANPGKEWTNVGRKKAEAAAKAVGCRWVCPVFKDGPGRDRTDFNDLQAREGEQMVAAQIVGAVRSIDVGDIDERGPGEVIEVDFIQDESWRSKVPQTSSGKGDAANVQGVAVYIEHHRLLRGRLAFNAFTQAMELDGNDMADHHVAEFRRIMHADGFKAKKGDVADEMIAEARRCTVDPLAEYLNGLKWDGKERISSWLVGYARAEPSRFVHTAGRMFLIGAVARALKPGVKMDTALILEGEQGLLKSTMLRYLFGDRFFVDNLPDFHSKDAFQQLQGHWCVEIAEMSALTKADVNDVKQFLSRLVDTYRPPYGKMPIKVPRRCVFAGTLNPEFDEGYLKDQTGGRRFWPVAVREIDLAGILRDRDQLWAEAVHAYQQGEPWWMEEQEDKDAALIEQAKRREIDPWEALLSDYIFEHAVTAMTIERALRNVVNMDPKSMDQRARRRMGNCLRAVGWVGELARLGGAGVQRVFKPIGAKAEAEPAEDDAKLPFD